MKDKVFLEWLADRLVHVYDESDSADFVHKLKSIAANYDPETDTYLFDYQNPKHIENVEQLQKYLNTIGAYTKVTVHNNPLAVHIHIPKRTH